MGVSAHDTNRIDGEQRFLVASRKATITTLDPCLNTTRKSDAGEPLALPV